METNIKNASLMEVLNTMEKETYEGIDSLLSLAQATRQPIKCQ